MSNDMKALIWAWSSPVIPLGLTALVFLGNYMAGPWCAVMMVSSVLLMLCILSLIGMLLIKFRII